MEKIKLQISSTPVQVLTRTLKAYWSMDLVDELMGYDGRPYKHRHKHENTRVVLCEVYPEPDFETNYGTRMDCTGLKFVADFYEIY